MRRLALAAALAVVSTFVYTACDQPNLDQVGPTVRPTVACELPDLGSGATYDTENRIHDCIVHGQVAITNATSAVFDNVVFDGSGTFAVQVGFDAGFVVLDHVEISGDYTSAGVFASGTSTSIQWSHIFTLHAGADGVKAHTMTSLHHSIIDLTEVRGTDPDPHEDGVQIESAVANVSLTTSRIKGGSNAAIQISPEVPSENGAGPVVMDDLTLACDGCVYPVRFFADQGHTIAGVSLAHSFIFAGSGGYIQTNYSGWTSTANQACAPSGSSFTCSAL